jgi:L-seryl-tRNA(Ser) seleniumtransferase
MQAAVKTSIFERLGVKPVLNARGFNTVVGGNTPTARMKEAIEEVERYYVDMREMLDRSGERIAELMGAEAAYVTPGAAAALALGAAACITGTDVEKMGRLPDTTGLKGEVVIQRPQIYQYDRAVTTVGARLVEIGSAERTTPAELEATLGPQTACVLFAAHLDDLPGIVRLDEVLRIAHGKGVPVLVDAAAQVYPLERFLSFPKTGADLIAYSCKYFGGPNSTGILVGRRELIEAASLQGFIGFEHVTNRKGLGRGYKLDRQEIVCAVIAVEDWLSMDHGRRLADVERRIGVITRALEKLPGVSLELLRRPGAGPRALAITVDAAAAKRSAEDVVRELREGNPSIWVNARPGVILVNPEPLRAEGDVEIVARRIRELLA